MRVIINYNVKRTIISGHMVVPSMPESCFFSQIQVSLPIQNLTIFYIILRRKKNCLVSTTYKLKL